MDYLLWKLVHIASVVLFLGNISTGLFWAARAHNTRDFAVIARTFDSINRSDRLFTIPAVIGITVSGFATAIIAHFPILSTGWVVWGIALFSISGIVFGIWLAPLQRRIAEMAHAAAREPVAWETYLALYRKLEIWAWVALATPLLALVIMVLKPALPGF